MNANKKSKSKRITDRPKALVKMERGVWVFQGEMTEASIPDLMDRERDKRSREVAGRRNA